MFLGKVTAVNVTLMLNRGSTKGMEI